MPKKKKSKPCESPCCAHACPQYSLANASCDSPPRFCAECKSKATLVVAAGGGIMRQRWAEAQLEVLRQLGAPKRVVTRARRIVTRARLQLAAQVENGMN